MYRAAADRHNFIFSPKQTSPRKEERRPAPQVNGKNEPKARHPLVCAGIQRVKGDQALNFLRSPKSEISKMTIKNVILRLDRRIQVK